jgi:hypothetical protein
MERKLAPSAPRQLAASPPSARYIHSFVTPSIQAGTPCPCPPLMNKPSVMRCPYSGPPSPSLQHHQGALIVAVPIASPRSTPVANLNVGSKTSPLSRPGKRQLKSPPSFSNICPREHGHGLTVMLLYVHFIHRHGQLDTPSPIPAKTLGCPYTPNPLSALCLTFEFPLSSLVWDCFAVFQFLLSDHSIPLGLLAVFLDSYVVLYPTGYFHLIILCS